MGAVALAVVEQRWDGPVARSPRFDGRWSAQKHHDSDPEPLDLPTPEPLPPIVAPERDRGARGERRSTTIPASRLRQAELREAVVLARDDAMGEALLRRPRTRADCVDGPRPCPWAACRWHLALDVDPDTGSLKLNFPGVPIEEMEHTCALDLADRGGMTLEETGTAIGLTRERIRQVEEIATQRLRDAPVVDWLGEGE